MSYCSNLRNRICKYLSLKEEFFYSGPKSDEELLRQAQEELDQAHNLFSRVDDPDMIESAIYYLKAAEKRYDYLLKKIKSQHKACNDLL